MNIPNLFKTAIEKIFFEDINLLSSTTIKDSYGRERIFLTGSVFVFKGNFIELTDDTEQTERGVNETYTARITTHSDIPQNESIVSYNNKNYKIVRVVNHDSHNVLLLEERKNLDNEEALFFMLESNNHILTQDNNLFIQE